MALFSCRFDSFVLHAPVEVAVFIPSGVAPEKFCAPVSEIYDEAYLAQTYPTLYLLHGGMDSGAGWITKSNVLLYAEEKGLAVVMPSIGNNLYVDHAFGSYYTLVAEELVQFTRKMFPLSRRREDTFLAGLSMGGYGALYIGLKNPQVFSAIGAMSAVADLADMLRSPGPPVQSSPQTVFCDMEPVEGTEYDLFHLLGEAAGAGAAPRIWHACGTDDFLLAGNRKFRDLASGLDLDYTYLEEAGGHEWYFWDRNIRRIVAWL